MGIFIPVLVVVAVDEQRVVVLVRVPERPVLPVSKRATDASAMMVRNVIVIVGVYDSRMRVCRLVASALHLLVDFLRCHPSYPFCSRYSVELAETRFWVVGRPAPRT